MLSLTINDKLDCIIKVKLLKSVIYWRYRQRLKLIFPVNDSSFFIRWIRKAIAILDFDCRAGPIFSAITLTLNLRFSPPFYIGFKGKVKLKWSGEYGSSTSSAIKITKISITRINCTTLNKFSIYLSSVIVVWRHRWRGPTS